MFQEHWVIVRSALLRTLLFWKMVINFWLYVVVLLWSEVRRALTFWFQPTWTLVGMILCVPSCTFRVCSIWFLCHILNIFWTLLVKEQLDINFLMFRSLGRRTSETSFGFLFDVSYVVLLNLLMDWFSDHWVFEKSIKHSKTWLIFSHCSVQMCWFWLRSWTSNRVSSRLTSLSFIEFFWLDWRLETSLNLLFFLPFLFITQMFKFPFSILNVFVHSVNEFLFLRSCHLFTKFSSFSLNFHCFEFLLKL